MMNSTKQMTNLKTIGFFVLLFLMACNASNNEQNQPNEPMEPSVDTLTVDEHQFKTQPNLLKTRISKPNGLLYSEFHNGDTLIVSVNYAGENEQLNKQHTVGIRPDTDNFSITRIGNFQFQLIIDENNENGNFSFEPYISANNVVFEDAYFDSIKGFVNQKYGNVLSPYQNTYPISERD